MRNAYSVLYQDLLARTYHANPGRASRYHATVPLSAMDMDDLLKDIKKVLSIDAASSTRYSSFNKKQPFFYAPVTEHHPFPVCRHLIGNDKENIAIILTNHKKKKENPENGETTCTEGIEYLVITPPEKRRLGKKIVTIIKKHYDYTLSQLMDSDDKRR